MQDTYTHSMFHPVNPLNPQCHQAKKTAFRYFRLVPPPPQLYPNPTKTQPTQHPHPPDYPKINTNPRKQEKNCFSPPVSAKNTKSSSFQTVSPTKNQGTQNSTRTLNPQ
jgi:hypothetical protein